MALPEMTFFFDPKRMRWPTRDRRPFPGTRVMVTGTRHNEQRGVVVEEPSDEFKNRIAVRIGGVVLGFYTHQIIEILAEADGTPPRVSLEEFEAWLKTFFQNETDL